LVSVVVGIGSTLFSPLMMSSIKCN
jgi:hypothetical protein